MNFCLNNWLTSLVFPDPGRMQPSSTCCKIGQHVPCHGVERFYESGFFQDGTDNPEISLASSCKSKHEVAKNLLIDVENVDI